MSKRKQIDNISIDHARSIVLRFKPATWEQCQDKTDSRMKALAREYCRHFGITPKEAISKPLPK
jgi:hypothetical protein